MSKWIKCGLPWTHYGDWKDYPKPPNLDKEIKKLFGTTATEMYKTLPKIDDPGFKKASNKYKRFVRKVNEWSKEHPLTKSYYELLKSIDEENRKKSFCGMELNKSGTLVEILDNKQLKQFLIGNINTLGGVCDDCMGFSKEAIVVRYKVLG
jgi:hypothetical protein